VIAHAATEINHNKVTVKEFSQVSGLLKVDDIYGRDDVLGDVLSPIRKPAMPCMEGPNV
jgi:hypothetical protein